jgi:hypothetical protein
VTQAPGRNVTSSRQEVPVFVAEENRAKLMAIYDEALRQWPVPFETFFVATRRHAGFVNSVVMDFQGNPEPGGLKHSAATSTVPAAAEFSAEQMLRFPTAKPFGGSRLSLETISEKSGPAVASGYGGHPIR